MLNRLRSAQYPDGSTAGWGYDAVGNRTSATVGAVTTTASYDATNRLCWTAVGTATGPCASAPAGATTYG